MSATINVKLFADYFVDEKVHVIEVPGRLFPIKLHYRPMAEENIHGRRSKAERLSPEPYIQIMQMIDNKYPSKCKILYRNLFNYKIFFLSVFKRTIIYQFYFV